jgi:TolA-binding protein
MMSSRRWAGFFASALVLGSLACGEPPLPASHPRVELGLAPRQLELAPPATSFAATPCPDDPIDLARDARHFRSKPRPAALLVSEIQGLEGLLRTAAVSPKEARERLLLLRRLAEDYAELASAALPHPQKSAPREEAIREARRRYADILVEAHQAGDGDTIDWLDEAEYYFAYESERAGDGANARRLYRDVASSYPDSPFAPLAEFGIGEIDRAEAADDPGALVRAEDAYEAAAEFSPTRSRIYGWALVRLGEMAARRGDLKTAGTRYISAAAFAKSRPSLPMSRAIAAAVPAWIETRVESGNEGSSDETDSSEESESGAHPLPE